MLFGVAHHLFGIPFGVIEGDIGNFACSIGFNFVNRVDKTAIRRKVQLFETIKYFSMKIIIYLNSILFNQILSPFKIAFRFYALYLGQQFAK